MLLVLPEAVSPPPCAVAFLMLRTEIPTAPLSVVVVPFDCVFDAPMWRAVGSAPVPWAASTRLGVPQLRDGRGRERRRPGQQPPPLQAARPDTRSLPGHDGLLDAPSRARRVVHSRNPVSMNAQRSSRASLVRGRGMVPRAHEHAR